MDTKKNMSREQLLAYMRDNCTEAEAQQVRMWLRERLKDLPIQVMSGMEGLLAAAELAESDTVVTAVMGSVGLEPTLAAIRKKKRIALANKETLVCAGELVMAEAKRCGAAIVPVDSEHSAIFQSLQGCRDRSEIKRLLLTCSGGPFFGKSFAELEHMTAGDALRHPNWTMGAKITIDSATLMNKGLEIIEAMRLYGLPLSQVEAVIHRQSIVHSLVEFRDGAMLAQLGTPDMKLPIRYALNSGVKTMVQPVIGSFADGCPLQETLQVGDRIAAIDGEKIYVYSDLSLLLNLNQTGQYDLTVVRDGKKVELSGVSMERREYTDQNGKAYTGYGLNFTVKETTLGDRLQMSFANAADFVRMVRLSLQMLVTGQAGVKDISGPVGIVTVITDVGQNSGSTAAAVRNIA